MESRGGPPDLFFFFQAEDGIRDVAVTGVQTCALPIFRSTPRTPSPTPARKGGDSVVPTEGRGAIPAPLFFWGTLDEELPHRDHRRRVSFRGARAGRAAGSRTAVRRRRPGLRAGHDRAPEVLGDARQGLCDARLRGEPGPRPPGPSRVRRLVGRRRGV